MITRTKEILKKLEIDVLELVIGALMILSLVGYFWPVTPDSDWFEHTVSFIVFSYLFYKVGVSSLLLGYKSKKVDLLIIFSYFILFLKDILIYTEFYTSKFDYLKIVDILLWQLVQLSY